MGYYKSVREYLQAIESAGKLLRVKPTSLPKREFMQKALEIWNRLELPPLHLKSPWYGHELGDWSERNREEAQLALQGRHFEIGQRAALGRRRLD